MTDDIDEREWLRQEQARLGERAGLDTADSDSLGLRYRRVARELARDPEPALPSNFAHVTSIHVEAAARQRRREQARFERKAFTWLAAIAGIGACTALAIYGRGWWSAIERAGWLHAQALPWLFAIAICGLLSRLLEGTQHAARKIRR